MKWIKTLASYALIFTIIYTVVNYWRAPTSVPLSQVSTLETSTTLGISPAVLQQSHQTPVLVYFWATWCGVCSITSGNVQAISQTHPVQTIAIQSGTADEVHQFMKNHGYDFAVVHDMDGRIFDAWQGQVTPSFVIIKDGQVVQRFTGIAPLWSLKVRLWWAMI
ncbi:protein disulfide oxidoreductase [Moraxella sp. FZFQ2102]|uniref:protein disulfide oxidoreductase n=1 Tax=Moraxella sp. FZFQ2102 TaxID=2953752 RepID=UPI00209BC9E1|nr:protein disulfide oxidoreductase [Moraxella sp. FZFQ2102]USZ14243.1 protein disulfide oxidoreductase [Moraxella sp. FZFQ2102]